MSDNNCYEIGRLLAEARADLWRERDQHTRDHQRLMEQCLAWEASSMEQGARCAELEKQLAERTLFRCRDRVIK